MCCHFREKCTNSHKIGLGCSTPLTNPFKKKIPEKLNHYAAMLSLGFTDSLFAAQKLF